MKRMVLIPEERLLRYEQRDMMRGNEDAGVLSSLIKQQKSWPDVGYYDDFNMEGKGKDLGEMVEDDFMPEVIVRGIPKIMKTRALALLERLKARPDMITWDNTGQVTLKGKFIEESNISDLISDAMRSRKHFNPVGVQDFFNVLREINIPKDLVRNEERWGEVIKKKVSFSDKVQDGGTAFFTGKKREVNVSKGMLKQVDEQAGKKWINY